MERPHTYKSGTALQSTYSVHHRSDILLHEQVEAVKKGQEELKRALSDLEVARGEEDVDRCRALVQEAKEKSEKAVLVLQVLTKVNVELQFARAELEEALEKQEGDINEARKRVMWLEDRMGVLCGKARIRTQAFQKPKKSHRSEDQSGFRSRLGTATDSDSDDDYPVKSTHRVSMFTPSASGSEPPPDFPRHRGMEESSDEGEGPYMGGPAHGMGMMHHRGLADSDSDSEGEGMPPPTLHGMPQISGPAIGHAPASARTESSMTSDAGTVPQSASHTMTSQRTQQVSFRPDSEVSDAGDQSEYSAAPPTAYMAQQAVGGSYSVIQPQEQDDKARPDDQTVRPGDEAQPAEPEGGESGGTEAEPGSDREGREDEGQEREKSEVSEDRTGSARSDASDDTQSQTDPAFLTEAPLMKERSVTILDPQKRRVRDETRVSTVRTEDGKQVSEVEEDRARDYWLSEHHRFEYSEYSEVLLEIDPLSYHNVGLAVPGSFIEKPSKDRKDLPWRARRKGSDINDVHKIALNKLSDRVHSMYGKMYDAALLSVRPLNAGETRREPSMFSNYDGHDSGRTPTESGPGMVTAPPTTADGISRPQTVVSSVDIVPSKLRPGLMVYHPKPIPPPEMLPLTRISKDKEFPRIADQFLEEDDILTHKPAVRIVDQRNLYKETKLKLYRDRPKKAEEGPSSMEKKFRMMLEQEKSMASRSSRSSRQTTPSESRSSSGKTSGKGAGTRLSMLSRAVTKAETGPGSETGDLERENTEASTWSRLKPSSRGKEYSGLKWERVKTLVHVQLVSPRVEERRDAAKHLGLLRCGDAMVFFALKERLRVEEDSRVRYEAAKSLVLLGCWEEDVLQVVLKYLVVGNSEVRQDLILTMIDGKNVQYVNKKIAVFPELVKVLSHFCRNPDPDDTIAFDAAVLLGKFCVMDENARFKLLRSLDQSTDTHVKAKALETLVKQLNVNSWDVVQHLLSLFKQSSVWRYRALAADLLIVLGKEHVCKQGEEERIYMILERKLWDDPNRDVRVSAAKALTALGMFSKACDRIEKRLEDTDEDIRAQAVISVGTLEMKNEKIIRLLLEMLELDTSEYVRLMIARTFATLKLTDKRVLRALRERDKVEGALARESRKALKTLECLAALPRLTSPTGRKSMASRASVRGATPRYTPAVIA